MVTIRPAVSDDVSVLDQLIAASARALSVGHYDAMQTEAAIAHIFGVDRELIEDGSYLLVQLDGEIAGCGGWSRRATLFGSDRYAGRVPGFVDPHLAPAKIRAFFVAPSFARRGLGTLLLGACEQAARSAGFLSAELMATLPGVPFYAARGYAGSEQLVQSYNGVDVSFIRMQKALSFNKKQSVVPNLV